MAAFKRNQVEDAITQTFGASGMRTDELRLRLKRLLAADRRLGRPPKARDPAKGRYAFFSRPPPGKGTEVEFTGYEAFALAAGLMVLEHGLPQTAVVKVMRGVRAELEAAHQQTLNKDAAVLFDPQAVAAEARPGMLATDNIAPVFLVFLRLTGSAVGKQDTVAAVCQGRVALAAFMKQHAVPGSGATIFELVRVMHTLAAALAQTRAVQRGRAAKNVGKRRQ